MGFSHFSVMLDECINGLDIKPNGIYIDGTCGGAGHSKEIAKRLTEGGMLIGIDRDPDAVAVASERLVPYNAKVLKGNFSDMKALAAGEGISEVDGILLDLGVSSHQLDTLERGFSYHGDAPLDMRMSQEGISAKDKLDRKIPPNSRHIGKQDFIKIGIRLNKIRILIDHEQKFFLLCYFCDRI